MTNLFKKVFVAAAALFIGVAASAQVTTSSLAGRVSDAQGPVSGAVVTATYTTTGTSYYAVADANGLYRLNGVNPGGPYTVSVSMLGYRPLTVTGLTAPLGETLVLDLSLEDESISLEGVVVSADAIASNMNIHHSGAGTAISSRKMEDIPSVGRSMNDVMKLTPQASTVSGGFAVGGGNYRGSAVTVDGAAFNNAFGIGSNLPAGGSPISIDALEQISVNITPFDVRQSGFQGGAINAVTKQGTNEFHASAYNYYTSEKFRGEKIGEDAVTNNPQLNNTTGITVGGPIIKNKLFFFVNAEYSLDEVPGSSQVARASEDTPWNIKEASNVSRPTVDQMETMKSYVGEMFGYNPGRYQGYSLSTPDYKILARLDWNINDNNKLNLRFSNTHNYYSSSPSSSMSPVGGNDSAFGDITFNRNSAGRQSKYAMFYEAARYYQEQNFLSLAAELNSRLLDGKANNMVRVAWSHQYEPRSFEGDLFPTVDILSNAHMEGAAASDTHAILTTIGVDPFTYGNLRDVNTVTATDEFTYSLGMHNLIAGAQFEWNRAINGFQQGGAGWYIYDSWESFVKDVENPSSATGPVAFMITHANLDDPQQQAFPTFDYTQVSAYAQDEITFSDYFKLTAGLRLEMPILSIPTANENKAFTQLGVEHPESSFAGLRTDDLPAPSLSVSPRVGFNWDVLKNRSLVVRGGTGLYTGRIPNVWLVSAIGNSNVLQYQYINKDVLASNASNATNIHFHQNRKDVINMLYPAGQEFKQQDLSAPSDATIISKELKMPSSWKSSLAIDAKLPFGINATLEGIYSKNFNEVYATSLGYTKTGEVQLPGEPAARELWGLEDGLGKKNGYLIHNEKISGHYYSITAQLSKDFANGLSLMAAYTNSNAKSLTDGNGDQISEFGNIVNRMGCNTPELGYSGYVVPNRVIANIAYTLKEGKLGATKVALFYEGLNNSASGARMSYTMTGVSGVRKAAQLVYIPTEADLENMPFADADNKAAFAEFVASDKYLSAHRGEYAKRNAVVAPWLNRINFRIAQDCYLNVNGKKHTLELAADINNVANLLNSEWGTLQQVTSTSILGYKDGAYTFTAPTWKVYNNVSSTWQMLFSAKYSF